MTINFNKEASGLIPAIIQDEHSNKVLMLGFMNAEAYEKTVQTGQVTFFSRTRKRLWTKGEESGNFLNVVSITTDCDQDTLLIRAIPVGPVCHTGSDTCWDEVNPTDDFYFLKTLQDFIAKRKVEMPKGSYTTSLFESGTAKIAQKVGEEAVETVIEAMANNDERLIYEASDLLYHLMVLLSHKGLSISDLATELKKRHK
ncbi:MAG: bifunctional phosphoribosyl-AMP cyclohydrolase/phosphoribosyl-ATP diphosphatase HisIE [Bacteroidetes bacterium]|nr:bifunctional phosphoribosyl-AMP cyclohydrolase/phosphoribosyl-ATP diphosphatase HisIE [Bacteroidota bacterium]MCL6103384.1 bifunctional phosphoribosyl-AMP cyclohydrolase/phosphoribosyl-ATP diphosphatase HisIE [Bacteroidota bacterium]